MVHARLWLRDAQFKALTWPVIAGSLGQNLRWRGVSGRRKIHTIYHAKISGVTRPEQLFLRPYGDKHGTDHYNQYSRGVSEASAQVRGAKSPG